MLKTYWGRDKMATLTDNIFKYISLNENLGSNWQYGNIDSDNGLAQNRWQASIWTNIGTLYWRKYASLGLRGN